MSDEETRIKRAMKFRNPVAKEVRENEKFRMRRVEDKNKRYARKSRQQLMKDVFENDGDEAT